jgi:RND family efflux transporter MFP subunit
MTHLFAILIMLMACGGCSGGEARQATEPATPPVVLGPDDVAVATMSDLASGVVITGTLQPAAIVEVKAQVGGTIQRLTADRGVAVNRGQRLASIEAIGVQSQVSGARAGVAAGESAIAAAEANVAAARQRLEGARTLHAAGAMSTVDLQSAEAQHEAAVGQLAAARAQTAAAKSQLAGASETAGRTTVVAPITGVVSERGVNEGEAVNSGQTLFTIVNPDRLELAGQIPVQQASAVKVGQTVSFSLDAYGEKVFTGRVARIDPVADPNTRQVGIALELSNPGRTIIAGQFVTGRVITANIGQAITVPRAAVRGPDDRRHVLVIEGNTVRERAITAGVVDPSRDTVAIASGLRAGERVIVSPDPAIVGGTVVRDEAAAPAQGQ